VGIYPGESRGKNRVNCTVVCVDICRAQTLGFVFVTLIIVVIITLLVTQNWSARFIRYVAVVERGFFLDRR